MKNTSNWPQTAPNGSKRLNVDLFFRASQRRHEDIAASFEEGREGRGILAKLYEQRNKEILDRLVAMRAKSDREAKMNLDQLKAA